LRKNTLQQMAESCYYYISWKWCSLKISQLQKLIKRSSSEVCFINESGVISIISKKSITFNKKVCWCSLYFKWVSKQIIITFHRGWSSHQGGE